MTFQPFRVFRHIVMQVRPPLARYSARGLILLGFVLFSTILRGASGPGEAILTISQRPPPASASSLPPDILLMPPAPRDPSSVQPHSTIAATATPLSSSLASAQSLLSAIPTAPPRSEAPPAVATTPGPLPTVAATATTRPIMSAAPALAPPLPPTSTTVPAVPTTAPTPIPQPPTVRIVIPRIKIDAAIVDVGVTASGEMSTVLEAVGRLALSAQAGEIGNVVLAAHNDVGGAIFRRLPELRAGDDILLYRGQQAFRYQVDVHTIVREAGVPMAQRIQNAQWMAPTDQPATTLISCWPYRVDTHRVIVRAVLESITAES